MTRLRSIATPPPWAAGLLIVFGLVALIGAAAGIADVAKHGRRMIGPAEAYGRYQHLDCGVPGARTGCTQRHIVHLAVERPQQEVQVDSRDLYDLVGEGERRVPVQLEIDTFDHHLSRASADGNWYVIDDTGKTALIVLIPLAVLGLALVAISLPALARPAAGWLTASTRLRRWVALVVGGLVLLICIVLAVVGIADKGYDEGQGALFGPYATFRTGNAYYEGVHVRVPGESQPISTDSSTLYDLVSDEGANLPVEVYEDSAGEVEAVTYNSDTYRVGASDLLALVVVIPLGLLGLATAWLNARALWRARAVREAQPAQ